MKKYVVTPRRGLWWLEAVSAAGDPKPVRRYSTEKAALRRLHEIQVFDEAMEMRQVAREASRFWIAP